MKKVPRLTIINNKCVNSDFCNYAYANKNCYLTFGCHYEEDCLYTDHSDRNLTCLDIRGSRSCELSYDCVDCAKCFQSTYLDFSKDCLDCHFLYNSSGCQNCFLSANLLNQKFIFKNQQLSEADYKKKVAEYLDGTYQHYQQAIKEYKNLIAKTLQRYTQQVQCVNCFGDNLVSCKNLYYCFNARRSEDCTYGQLMDEQYDSVDINYMGYDRSEECYQTIGCSGIFSCYFCDSCWHNRHLQYCNLAFSSQECFGCVGIKNKKYCILNKQYSEDDYLKLKNQIIKKMAEDGEYGHFFPYDSAPYGYNLTVNMEPTNHPLIQIEVEKLGGWWQNNLPGTFGKETIKKMPENIKDCNDDITKEILVCADCGKNYKIIPEELSFYQKLNLPLPRLCPDCRYYQRLKRRNPYKLYHRQCMRPGCTNEFETTYAPDRPERVYCEECYQKEIY
jgi:hypothetical protein